MKYEKCSCVHCGQNIEYPSEGKGDTVPCPTCGGPVILHSKKDRKSRVGGISIPLGRLSDWIDNVVKRNKTVNECHWLAIGPLNAVLGSDSLPITTALCRQIAELIESKGYCVETDIRSGCSTYYRAQTLAIFRAFEGDSPAPSSSYVEAANLLRLCLHIVAADSWISPANLDVFRQTYANSVGLSRTDRKRLIILEQLLAQRLCISSYYNPIAKFIKFVSLEKRPAVAKFLVEVAVASYVMTDGQRRVLERIFNGFEIPLSTLSSMINQACPRLRYVVLEKRHWSLKEWRVHRGGIVIDDNMLAEKKWNLTNWKVLNARWRTLHQQLVSG